MSSYDAKRIGIKPSNIQKCCACPVDVDRNFFNKYKTSDILLTDGYNKLAILYWFFKYLDHEKNPDEKIVIIFKTFKKVLNVKYVELTDIHMDKIKQINEEAKIELAKKDAELRGVKMEIEEKNKIMHSGISDDEKKIVFNELKALINKEQKIVNAINEVNVSVTDITIEQINTFVNKIITAVLWYVSYVLDVHFSYFTTGCRDGKGSDAYTSLKIDIPDNEFKIVKEHCIKFKLSIGVDDISKTFMNYVLLQQKESNNNNDFTETIIKAHDHNNTLMSVIKLKPIFVPAGFNLIIGGSEQKMNINVVSLESTDYVQKIEKPNKKTVKKIVKEKPRKPRPKSPKTKHKSKK